MYVFKIEITDHRFTIISPLKVQFINPPVALLCFKASSIAVF